MATIDDKEIIRGMLKNSGYYAGDPQCFSIWSYQNQFGNMTQAVFWNPTNDMLESSFVHDPQLLWSKRHGLTPQGREWLKSNG